MTHSLPTSLRLIAACAIATATLGGCGGGTANGGTSSGGAPVSTQVSGTSPFASGCGTAAPNGDLLTIGSGVQPQISVASNGTLVGVWEQDRWSGPGARGVLASTSADGGAHWSTPAVLQFSACGAGNGVGATYDRASDPWVVAGGNGFVYASALAFSASGILAPGGTSAVLVARSTDSGATWSGVQAVKADSNPLSGTFFFNDRDSMAADAVGNVYLVWDRITSDTTTGGIPGYLARSNDSGVNWTTSVMDDPGPGMQSFNNQVAILPSGVVIDIFTLLPTSNPTLGTLQVIRSSNSGLTWTTSKLIANIVPVGTANPILGGRPIRDSSLMAQIAVDPASGAIAVVWQQSFGSTTFDGIALSVSNDGGITWSTTPLQINGVKTVAAFNPTVRYLPGGVLAVTYYDLRDFAVGSSILSTSVWLTESADGGATWHELRLQGPFDLNTAPLTDQPNGFATALFLGDNQGLALVGSAALPFYAATNSAGAHVYSTKAPSPLTLSTAHVYQAGAANGSLSAAVQARAAINARQVMARRRAAPPSR
jgi:hypothetical protein